MALNNKFVRTGEGAGQLIGGGPEFYALAGNIAFFREDFNATALDSDEWITTVSGSGLTGLPAASSAGIFLSSGYAIMASGTATAGLMRLTSKRTFAIPFRFHAAVGIDGISSAGEVSIQIRDTSGISATTVTGNPTYLARFRCYGSAGGTEHTAAMEIRAGGTAAGFIPQATSTVSMSAAAGAIAGSAALSYIIDVDYNGITFATQSTNAISMASSTLTTMLPPPFVLAHYPAPMMKTNQKYCVEFVHALGSATIETAGASNTSTAGMVQIYFAEVRQYAPAASLQRPGPLLTYLLTPTGGGGTPSSTAITQMGGYLKWY